MLAEAVARVLPFRLPRYGSSYALLQLPQVQAILASPAWASFQQQVLDCHNKVEQQRQSPWATLAPGLAGRLDQLVDSVQHLTTAVSQQQEAQQQAQQEAQQQAQQQLQAAQPPSGQGHVHAAAATATASQAQHSSKAQVVPALYSSRVKTVDDAFQVETACLQHLNCCPCSCVHSDWCMHYGACMC